MVEESKQIKRARSAGTHGRQMQPEQHRDRDDVDGHTFRYQVRDGSTRCSRRRRLCEGRRVRMTDRRRMLSADSDLTSLR
jgi:hypothetical protein